MILGIFIVRIPTALTPEIDIKGAASFLKENFSEDDCLICVSTCPSERITANIIRFENNFKLNKEKSEFVVKSPNIWESLKHKMSFFKKIWFYRAYGKYEVFGANQLLDGWLKTTGYSAKKITRFRNLEIICYEK